LFGFEVLASINMLGGQFLTQINFPYHDFTIINMHDPITLSKLKRIG